MLSNTLLVSGHDGIALKSPNSGSKTYQFSLAVPQPYTKQFPKWANLAFSCSSFCMILASAGTRAPVSTKAVTYLILDSSSWLVSRWIWIPNRGEEYLKGFKPVYSWKASLKSSGIHVLSLALCLDIFDSVWHTITSAEQVIIPLNSIFEAGKRIKQSESVFVCKWLKWAYILCWLKTCGSAFFSSFLEVGNLVQKTCHRQTVLIYRL